jgi:hypothetical protein
MIAAKKATRFPPGWLVAALLVASGILWAVMFFGTLAHLKEVAGGLAPFDVRPFGYSYADARAFLSALGEAGRAYYLDPELVLDSYYPPLYAVSRALALWWLTMPGRWREGATPAVWRWSLVAIPIVMAVLDGGVENVCIAKMLRQWPDLSPGLVKIASWATRVKLVMGVATEVAMAVFAVAAALRWSRLRRA